MSEDKDLVEDFVRHALGHQGRVYVCSPYAGNVEENRAAAVRYCRYVIRQGKIPVAAHLLYPQILDENDPDERMLGMEFGLALLAVCDEVWVFGKEESAGMRREIEEAAKLGKPIFDWRKTWPLGEK